MEELRLDVTRISDGATCPSVERLLNLVEQLRAPVQALTAENQQLRAEIRRLTGARGQPLFPAPCPPQRSPSHHGDISSEAERRLTY